MEKKIEDLPEVEYRAYKRESFSSIKYILKSPIDFLYYKDKPFKGSNASLLGTCVHHYIQGNKQLVAFNELTKIKKNAEAIAEFEKTFKESTNGEGVIVPKSFEPKLEQIMINFNAHKSARKKLHDATIEKAFLFEINGVELKGKVDILREDEVGEIKTSSQAKTLLEFREEAYDRDYDMQAYFYMQASGKKRHFFIVVNTVEPFNVMVYTTSPEMIESGRKKAYEATDRYRKYILAKQEWNEEETDGEL